MKQRFRNLFLCFTFLSLAFGCSISKKEQTTGEREQSIFNTEWKLVKIGSKTMKYSEGEDPISLLMTSEPENLSGYAGCNRYFGKFSIKKNKISFSQMGATMIACPEQDMDFENRYLQTFDKINNYTISNDTLYLRRDEKAMLIFTY